MVDNIDFSAILRATAFASFNRFSAGITRLTNPALSASSASMFLPVRCISIALDFPTNFDNNCVPPKPAITPKFISGCPNFALSAAKIKSHLIANSHPPPRAYPATAAIIGFLVA